MCFVCYSEWLIDPKQMDMYAKKASIVWLSVNEFNLNDDVNNPFVITLHFSSSYSFFSFIIRFLSFIIQDIPLNTRLEDTCNAQLGNVCFLLFFSLFSFVVVKFLLLILNLVICIYLFGLVNILLETISFIFTIKYNIIDRSSHSLPSIMRFYYNFWLIIYELFSLFLDTQ